MATSFTWRRIRQRLRFQASFEYTGHKVLLDKQRYFLLEIMDARLGFWRMSATQGTGLKAIYIWVTPEAQGMVGIPQVEKIEQRA